MCELCYTKECNKEEKKMGLHMIENIHRYFDEPPDPDPTHIEHAPTVFCRIRKCYRKHTDKGYCDDHYYRHWTTGPGRRKE